MTTRSGGESSAALVTTGLQDGATSSGLHPVAKTVLALPPTYFWLICPFHEFSTGSR